jgi:hypothetical protein
LTDVPLHETAGDAVPLGQTPDTVKAPEVKTEPAKTPSVRESLKAAVKAVNEQREAKAPPVDVEAKPEGRDDKGRFVPKDAKDKGAETQPDVKTTEKPLEAANTGAVDPKKADAAPGTWKPETRAKWANLDPEIRAEVLRRESESTREIAKHQTEANRLKTEYSEIENVIAPRKNALVQGYGSIGRAVGELFRLSDEAGKDPHNFYLWLCKTTGQQPKAFDNSQPAQTQPVDPTVMELKQQIHGLQGQVQGFFTQQQQQAVSGNQARIDKWAQATDANGQLLRPHFQTLQDKMTPLIQGIRQAYPDADMESILDKAYRAALNVDDTLAAQHQQELEQRIADKAAKELRAQKAATAAKFVNGTAPHETTVNQDVDPKDLRKLLKSNFRKVMNSGESRV